MKIVEKLASAKKMMIPVRFVTIIKDDIAKKKTTLEIDVKNT